MDTILLVVLVILGLLLLLAVIGSIAATLRNRAGAAGFSASLTAVDRQLAAATASDHGWERAGLDAAARRAFAQQRGAEPEALELVQIVDEPGTDSDLAIYRVTVAGGATARLTLGRREGAWYAKQLDDER